MVKPTTHSAYCFVSGQSDPSKTPTSSKFMLSIRQQPQRAKVCSVKERDRRPIDPPPIIQIKLAEPSSDRNKDYLQSPYLFMCCNLVHANEPEGEIVAPAHRVLAGAVVSSLNRLKDVDNSDGGFFVFGDISARIEGRFRLRFTLFELVEGQVVHVMSIASNPMTVHSSKSFPGMCESTFLSRSFSDQGVRIRIRKDHHVKPKRPVNDSPEADEEDVASSLVLHSPPSSCHEGDPSDYDSGHDAQPAKRTKPSSSSSTSPSSVSTSTASEPIAIASRSGPHHLKDRYSSEEISERTPPSSPGPYVSFGSAPAWSRHHPYRLNLSPRRYEDPRCSASLRFRDPNYEHDRPSAFYEGLHLESDSRHFEHPGFARSTLVHHPREIRGGRPEHSFPADYTAQRERSRSFGYPRYISTSAIGYYHHPFEGPGPYWAEGHPVYFHGPEPSSHPLGLAQAPSVAFSSTQASSLSQVTPSSKSSKTQIAKPARHGFPAALLNDKEMEDVQAANSSGSQHDVCHSRTPSMSSQHSENMEASQKEHKAHKERKEHKKDKKSKKHKGHKEHKKRKHDDDVDLNAGSFKKALVTPSDETAANTTATPAALAAAVAASISASAIPDRAGDVVTAASVFDELALFTGDHSSADESSSDEESTSAVSRSKALKNVRPENAAAIAAVADLLSTAGITRVNPGAEGGAGGVSAEVIKMQQQLQQQIPFESSSTSNNNSATATATTDSQFLESIAGIPSMQMLIQDSLSQTTAQQQLQHTQDANAILMSLSNDPSILATVSHPEHQPTLGQIMQQEKRAQEAAAAESIKKRKTMPKGNKNTRTGRPLSANINNLSGVGDRTLEEQLEYDLGTSSDSLLHTKWMMATELKERGIQYRMGTFSVEEDNVIRQSISEYIARHNMPEDSIREWFEKSSGRGAGKLERNELKPLWVEIAVRLKTRPLLNIYLHVRRMYHPQNNIGAWTKSDDAKLVELHAKHKGQWTVIGQALGRMADSCRDRFRNHLKDQATMNTGTWAPEEDRKLLDIMQELALKQGKTNLADATHMWTAISEKMGGTRSRHQCRHRYTQSLQPKMEMADWKPPTLEETMAVSNVIQLRKSLSAKSREQSQDQDQADTSVQQQQQQPAVGASEFTVPEEDIRVLAAALQGVIPSGSDGSLLWSQPAGASALSSADQADHATLTAAIAAATSLPVPTSAALLSSSASLTTATDKSDSSTTTTDANPNPLPPAPGLLQRRTGARQRMLDSLRLIEKSGYKEASEIKWKTMSKKLRSKIQEANGEILGKLIEARERVQALSTKYESEGNRFQHSITAAVVAAMDAAVMAAHTESVRTIQFSATPAALQNGFIIGRGKVEGYRSMPFKELIEAMIKNAEEGVSFYKVVNKTFTSKEYFEASAAPGPAANRETFISVARFRHLQTYFAAQLAAKAAMSECKAVQSIKTAANELLKEELNREDLVPILYKLRTQFLAVGVSTTSVAANPESGPVYRTSEYVNSGDEDSDDDEGQAPAATEASHNDDDEE
ncbi:hypothetical protein BGX33_006438 [Mortierella sp. NVP41]|nr:hypothetical protein BGX33_006438 [Mortierella sp. NVP41]